MADRAQGRRPKNRPSETGGTRITPGLASRSDNVLTARQQGTLESAWAASIKGDRPCNQIQQQQGLSDIHNAATTAAAVPATDLEGRDVEPKVKSTRRGSMERDSSFRRQPSSCSTWTGDGNILVLQSRCSRNFLSVSLRRRFGCFSALRCGVMYHVLSRQTCLVFAFTSVTPTVSL